MNILHCDLGNQWRGGQRQVAYLCSALAGLGFPCAVAATKSAPLAQWAREHSVEVFHLPPGRDLNPLGWLRLHSAAAHFGADIVHTHDARAASLATISKVLFSPAWKLVHSRRVSYLSGKGWSRAKYVRADRCIAVSRAIGEALAEGGVPREKIRVVHSGIDPLRYSIKTSTELPARPVIGLIGALTPQKGHALLLAALAGLAKEDGLPEWKAQMVGDGPLLSPLSILTGEMGLADRVMFLPRQESTAVLPGMDLIAVPSVDGEGSSAVIKEAWATGAPVIASDLPSNTELVEHEQSGLLFRSGSAEALTAGLKRLLLDGRMRRLLVEGGRERLVLFTARKMAESTAAIYTELERTRGQA